MPGEWDDDEYVPPSQFPASTNTQASITSSVKPIFAYPITLARGTKDQITGKPIEEGDIVVDFRGTKAGCRGDEEYESDFDRFYLESSFKTLKVHPMCPESKIDNPIRYKVKIGIRESSFSVKNIPTGSMDEILGEDLKTGDIIMDFSGDASCPKFESEFGRYYLMETVTKLNGKHPHCRGSILNQTKYRVNIVDKSGAKRRKTRRRAPKSKTRKSGKRIRKY